MSGIVVFIGYLILLPSLFGMVVSGAGLVIAVSDSSHEGTFNWIQSDLIEKGIPEPIIDDIISSRQIEESRLSALSPEQIIGIEAAESVVSSVGTGSLLAKVMLGGMTLFVFVATLVSGLVGWILVMKKRVLKCSYCHATNPAQ